MKPRYIELDDGRTSSRLPILHEDRSVLAIDKPAGWLLVPFNWQQTQRNLMAAITSSIAAGDFWARSRSLRFLRNVHRLDGDTSGVLLFAKSPGAVQTYGELFESRQMEKTYLAVVRGAPQQTQWICRAKIAPDPRQYGRMHIDAREGKDAETEFRVLESVGALTLVEARPYTGRTHQIRLHLQQAGLPVLGDAVYGSGDATPPEFPLALRAVELRYRDPFLRRPIRIQAPTAGFRAAFSFPPQAIAPPATLGERPPGVRPERRPSPPAPPQPGRSRAPGRRA